MRHETKSFLLIPTFKIELDRNGKNICTSSISFPNGDFKAKQIFAVIIKYNYNKFLYKRVIVTSAISS